MNDLFIKNMGNDIQAYLEKEKVTDAKPKHLMPFLIEKGYFKKDHRDGLPLRNMLRELDRTNRLHLIPQVRAERKEINVSWYFNSIATDFSSEILKYLEQNKLPFNRYNSWNHCYEAFGKIEDTNLLSLHLGFYLASWGMYRGSGKLLQKDYLVHEDAVNVIKDFKDLRCSGKREVDENDLDILTELIAEIKKCYTYHLRVPASNTLVSKVILGTLGCLPAFDRYFCDGVKDKGLEFRTLTKKSLENLFLYNEKMKKEFPKIRKQYDEIYYPNMKLIDMHFWQLGYELAPKKSTKKTVG